MDQPKGNDFESNSVQLSPLNTEPLRRRDVRKMQQASESSAQQVPVAPTPVWQQPTPIHATPDATTAPPESAATSAALFVPPTLKTTVAARQLITNPAGYHAIKQCLEVQGPVVGRKPLAKFFGISPPLPNRHRGTRVQLVRLRLANGLNRSTRIGWCCILCPLVTAVATLIILWLDYPESSLSTPNATSTAMFGWVDAQ